MQTHVAEPEKPATKCRGGEGAGWKNRGAQITLHARSFSLTRAELEAKLFDEHRATCQ